MRATILKSKVDLPSPAPSVQPSADSNSSLELLALPLGIRRHGESTMPYSAQTEAALKQLDIATRNVAMISDGIGQGIDYKIAPLVTALVAYKVSTYLSCEGHADRPGSKPFVAVGSSQIFQAHWKGDREEFNKALKEVRVPWQVYLRHPTLLVTGLTAEILRQIDSPRLREKHGTFWRACGSAYHAAQTKLMYRQQTYGHDGKKTPSDPELLPEAKKEIQVNQLTQAALLKVMADYQGSQPLPRYQQLTVQGSGPRHTFDITFAAAPSSAHELRLQQKEIIAFAYYLQKNFLQGKSLEGTS